MHNLYQPASSFALLYHLNFARSSKTSSLSESIDCLSFSGFSIVVLWTDEVHPRELGENQVVEENRVTKKGLGICLSMPLTTIASPLSWRFRRLGSLGALIHYSESNAVVHCGKSCPSTSATRRFTDGFHHRFTDIGVLTGKTSVVVAGKRSLLAGVRSLVERDNELSRKGLVVERTRKFVVEESGARHRRRLL
ncbi:hypothetical protein C8J56DRAFT_1066158 [Mycena floridula]|nr:hypothetical protein C8J56DRAFT_1066158 [Mycena floridula]